MRTWLVGSTIVAASLFLAAMMALGQGARGPAPGDGSGAGLSSAPDKGRQTQPERHLAGRE